MANEEVRTLLDNQPQPHRLRDDTVRSRRSHALRVAVGIVSALALVAGSCVAVELISEHQQSQAAAMVQTSSLSAHVTAPAPATMEAQLGWDTWCSVRATVQCLFSSENDKCKQEVRDKCSPPEPKHDVHEHGDGSGSGSGSGFGHGSGSGSRVAAGPSVGDPDHQSNNTAAGL